MALWTKAQVKAHQAALDAAQKAEEKLRMLEALARFNPSMSERVRELRDMRDNLEQSASTALTLDSEGA
jgi:U3 small nucleolar RNA-associated protein 14